MKNKKGFTLVELLAVIVILGVLLLIAVPGITKVINSSKKNTFISTAKLVAENAQTLAMTGAAFGGSTNCYIPLNATHLPLERGSYDGIDGVVHVQADKVVVYIKNASLNIGFNGETINNMNTSTLKNAGDVAIPTYSDSDICNF